MIIRINVEDIYKPKHPEGFTVRLIAPVFSPIYLIPLITVDIYTKKMEQGGATEKPRSIDYYTIKFPIDNFVETKSLKGEKIHNYRWPAHQDETVPP